MKKLYSVTVYGDGSQLIFKEYYTDEEIDIINKFFNNMNKHGVASYDIPAIEFEEVKNEVCSYYDRCDTL